VDKKSTHVSSKVGTSLTGLQSGTGTSGSTGWLNSVRSALYLEVVKGDNGPDPECRILKVVKANYGRTGEQIAVRWQDGIYVLDSGTDPLVENLLNTAVDKVFLTLLALFNAQEQNVSSKSGANYAPAKMALHPQAKGFNKKQLAASMQRLMDAKRIRQVTNGRPSRQRSWLVISEPARVH
jgi:RecA-family ATPase